MVRSFSLLLLIGASLAPAVHAAGLGAQGQPPEDRVTALTVYGSDPCPKADDGSIVVCARRPEGERYRIPRKLRESEQDSLPGAQGWGSTVQALDAASRAVLPGSCSPIGSYGQTGCTLAQLHQWYLERQLDGAAPHARAGGR